MTKNLIIKTSYSKLPNGEIKPNFGDLIRASVLLNCIKGDFVWLTDKRSINLLKYFIDLNKIINIETFDEKLVVDNIYNIDNYVANEQVFKKIKGNWHGFIWDGKKLNPENDLIKITAPPYDFSNKKSWQQALIGAMGFKWQQQDYFLKSIENKEIIDIGFNWHVNQEWTSKQWPKKNWKELEKLLKKDYSVSWQQGLNNFDEYVNWLSSCKLIITCETLGLHLALALKKKVIAIVGPAESNEFPYSRLILAKPSPRDCMPCFLSECKFKKTCLNEVEPKEIYRIVSQFF